MHAFDPHATEVKYVQEDENTCFSISLDSALFAANENVAEHSVVSRISSYLSCDIVGFISRIKGFQ